jgi:hypothetical protein
MAAVNAAEAKLKRATRALRADGVLRWTPTGEVDRASAHLRRQTRVASAAGARRPFQVGLISADAHPLQRRTADQLRARRGGRHRRLHVAHHVAARDERGGHRRGRRGDNVGSVETWPRFRIDGPITRPIIMNNTTGQADRVRLGQLLAGEYLLIDAYHASVLLGGDRRPVRPVRLRVVGLVAARSPGPTTSGCGATADAGAGALLTVYWRHAWE